jgi:hypothetical protein
MFLCVYVLPYVTPLWVNNCLRIYRTSVWEFTRFPQSIWISARFQDCEHCFTHGCVCVCVWWVSEGVCVCVCVWISMRVCCSQPLLQLFVSRLIDNRQERCCIAQPTFSDCAAILQTINTSTQSINKYRTHSNSVNNQKQNNDKIHRSTCCQCTQKQRRKEKRVESNCKK